MPSLSVIIPTLGRVSLKHTLESIAPQLYVDDEIIIVQDFDSVTFVLPQDLYHRSLAHIRIMAYGPTRNGGSSQRNFGATQARGEYLTYMDDDDLWVPGARTSIENALITNSRVAPHLFRMVYCGQVLWTDPQIRLGNIGTGMIVVPNIPEKLGTWTDRYEADFDFLTNWGWKESEVIWNTDILYVYNGRGQR